MDAVDDAAVADFERSLGASAIASVQRGLMADMDQVAKALVEQDAERA
jgi:hypothetical protein